MTATRNSLHHALEMTIKKLTGSFTGISDDRKQLLWSLSQFASDRVRRGQQVHLNFICTHNSRRSHIAQLWAQAAAYYYDIQQVQTYSGGTEATAFNPRSVKAMQRAGFEIMQTSSGDNPVYAVSFSNDAPEVAVFSKVYDHPMNPKTDFAAVMTCSHADENCPLILGAAKRIPLTYHDPKDFDNTSQEEEKYDERVAEIGREMLYAFSLLNIGNKNA